MKVTRYSFCFTLIFTISLALFAIAAGMASMAPVAFADHDLSETIQEKEREQREREQREREQQQYEIEKAQDRVEDWANSNHDPTLVMDDRPMDQQQSSNSKINQNDNYLILGGLVIVGIVVIAVIIKLIKKSNNTGNNSYGNNSTEQDTSDDYIDKRNETQKQIAINEEKIRKMEEESKKLDEED
jgi:septal ring-binding cell division protein DamX|tara:strand:- start:276 stop:833 length:558 start_codon:yes stop_codon:yes gene_type:complete